MSYLHLIVQLFLFSLFFVLKIYPFFSILLFGLSTYLFFILMAYSSPVCYSFTFALLFTPIIVILCVICARICSVCPLVCRQCLPIFYVFEVTQIKGAGPAGDLNWKEGN